MNLGIGLGVTNYLRVPTVPLDPDAAIAALFSSGEVGAWYDPSDSTTVFQDAAGTTAAGVGDPVGLILDKSQGLTLGAELFSDFATEGLWTDNGNGSWSITNAATNTDLRSAFLGVTGKRYVVSITFSNVSGTLTFYPLHTSPIAVTSDGTYVVRQEANGGVISNGLWIRATTGSSATVSNISIRELPGNHATQTTSAARPTLQVTGTTPATLGSEEVTNGTFDAGLTGWTSGGFDPATLDSGGAKIERDAVTNSALVQANVFVVGKTYRISYDVLSGSGNTGASLLIVGQNADSVPGSYSFVHTATTTTFEARCYLNNYATIDNITVKEVLTWADPKYYLDFDGVDDSLRTTFSANQAQPNTISVAFKFDVASRLEFVIDGIGSNRHTLYKASTNLALFAGTALTDPSVIGTVERVAFGHLNGVSSDLRVDGLSVATGTVSSSPWGGVTLGANSSPTPIYHANGRIYGFVGVNRTLTAGEITDLETYLAAKSGVTL